MDGQQHQANVAQAGNRTNSVNEFMARLDHPRKAEIEAVRAILLSADPTIQESIKWNAPSFSITEHFATFKLRPTETVQVVLHTGAKVKPTSTAMEIDDPAGLIQWATKDRGMVVFADMQHITAKQRAFATIVQQWIAQI